MALPSCGANEGVLQLVHSRLAIRLRPTPADSSEFQRNFLVAAAVLIVMSSLV